MNKDLFLANIERYCKEKKIKPTPACVEAGVGKSFISDIKRGQMPSVEKVSKLAAYLGVSISDLMGDAIFLTREQKEKIEEDQFRLATSFARMNPEGQKKLLDYADDLLSSGKYRKV